MNKVLYLFFLAFLSCTKAEMPLEGKRVLFLGDSITQNGQYVSFIQYYLQKAMPEGHFNIISLGLSSETLSCLTEEDHPFPRPCLRERLNRTLGTIQPDIIVACYGMNDAIYHPFHSSRFSQFQFGVSDLVQKAATQQATLILLTPPPFDSIPIQDILVPREAASFSYRSPYQAYNQVLRRYSDWLVAAVPGPVKVIDVHATFMSYLETQRTQNPSFTFTQDGIHPSEAGHLLMANIFLDAYGIETAKNLELELARLKDDPLFLAVAEKRTLLSEAYLPYIGYIRGDTVKHHSIDPALKRSQELQERIDSLLAD